MQKIKRINLSELALKCEVVSKQESRGLLGGYTVDDKGRNVYTVSEMESMANSGTWHGGLVGSWGYVGPQTAIFSGSGSYYNNLGSYANDQQVSFGNYVLEQIASSLPTGIITDGGAAMLENAKWALTADLIQSGNANTPIYTTYDESEGKYGALKAYNASSGELIGTYSLSF